MRTPRETGSAGSRSADSGSADVRSTEVRSAESASAEETRALGERLGRLLAGGDVIGLCGPLGAGKTCLVQGIARGLEVDASVPVTSPTFTLIGEYPGRVPLRHADFYRIESDERLFEAGFDDLLDGRGVLVVEWFERLPRALPDERLEISLEFASPELPPAGAAAGEPARPAEPAQRRRLHVRARGARARQLRDAWLVP